MVAIERWWWPDLCKCRSLRSLVFQFPTLSWSKEIRDELPSDPLIPVYDYTLAAIVEMVLSAPTEVATIGISFLHGSDYDDEVISSLAQLASWSRLDDALCGSSSADVYCSITKDHMSLVNNAPAVTMNGYESYMTIGNEVDSDDYVRLLKAKLPRLSAAGRLTCILVSA